MRAIVRHPVPLATNLPLVANNLILSVSIRKTPDQARLCPPSYPRPQEYLPGQRPPRPRRGKNSASRACWKAPRNGLETAKTPRGSGKELRGVSRKETIKQALTILRNGGFGPEFLPEFRKPPLPFGSPRSRPRGPGVLAPKIQTSRPRPQPLIRGTLAAPLCGSGKQRGTHPQAQTGPRGDSRRDTYPARQPRNRRPQAGFPGPGPARAIPPLALPRPRLWAIPARMTDYTAQLFAVNQAMLQLARQPTATAALAVAEALHAIEAATRRAGV